MILQSQLWMTAGLWSLVKSSVTVRTSFRGPSEFCRRVGLGLVFRVRVTAWKLPNSLLVCWYCSDMKRHRGRCQRLQPGPVPDPLWLDGSSASRRNSFFGLQNHKAAKGIVITEKSMFLFSSSPGYSTASSVRSTSTCDQSGLYAKLGSMTLAIPLREINGLWCLDLFKQWFRREHIQMVQLWPIQ